MMEIVGALLTRRRQACIAGALMLMWLVSLALPVARIAQHGGGEIPGLTVLLIGWYRLFGLQIEWLANPVLVLLLPIIAFATRPWRVVLFVGAIVLAVSGVSALSWNDRADAAPGDSITSYGPGFYLWLAAVFGTAITAFAKAIMEDRPDNDTI